MKKVFGQSQRTIMIILGSLITAVGINVFIIPHKLLSGGVSGIALIIQYMTGVPSGYLILAFNVPIFLIGVKEIDKDFIVYSLIGTLSLSLFLVLTKNLGNMILVNDILLSCIYGGVISGLGIGIVFRSRGSEGGTDILAVVIKKYSGVSIGTLTLIMNIVVVTIGSVIGGLNIALYTLISMYITSSVLNRVIEGLDRKKLLFIVTNNEEEVANALMNQIGRGVTYFYGEGAYTSEKRNIIYCIVSSIQLAKAKKIISDIDPSSFISIVDAGEVQGKGFKHLNL